MRDWTLPGYKYLGPGNRLNKGKPRNKNDAVAYKHDLAYDHHIKSGRNPYWNFNDADEKAMNEFTWDDYGGAAGKTFFQFKKLAWKAGLTGHLEQPSAKRLRGSEAPNIEPATKRLATARRQGSLPNSSRDTPSVPTSTARTMASNGNGSGGDGGGSGNNLGLKETPVDDPYNVHRGPPNETFASLPFVETRMNRMQDVYTTDFAYRMTSVYDPAVTTNNGIDVNPGVGDNRAWEPVAGSDATIMPARWFNFYSGIYRYYHVISCRYNIYIENMGGEPLFAHLMFYNNDLPPSGATNEDIMLWHGVQTKFMVAPFKAITSEGREETGQGNTASGVNDRMDENDMPTATIDNYETSNHVTSRGGRTSCQFTGEYRPGDFKREINLDSEVENWTLVTTNPTLSERLLLRLKPENPGIGTTSTSYGDDITYKIVVKLDYLVEFKELDVAIRYPVERQPITVVKYTDVTNALS